MAYVPNFSNPTVDAVITMVCWDATELNHMVACSVSHQLFRVQGPIPHVQSMTIFDAAVVGTDGYPTIRIDPQTIVIPHVMCEWADLHNVVSVCAGLGALEHGALSADFRVVAAVDQNPRMIRMHDAVHDLHAIQGDICQKETLVKLWARHSRPCVLVSGIACQPYSRLGDRKEGQDERAQSLPGTLMCAFYLRYPVVVLECVPQAKDSDWVNQQVNAFCSATGFRRTEQILNLSDLMPCRRSRWWTILSSPAIGEVPLKAMPQEFALGKMVQVVPSIIEWPDADETALRLNDQELIAFQAQDEAGPHAMNMAGVLPCPLHSWGSQMRPCPCQCRNTGLSSERLASRGLHGVIVQSAKGHMRHPHPCEVAAVAGLDPNLHHDDDASLALTGIGQLASPVQAVWVFASLAHRLEQIRVGKSDISPTKELLAYVGWQLARCRMLWSGQASVHPEVQCRIEEWLPFQTLSQSQLQKLMIWDAALPKSLASLFQQVQDAKPDSDVDRFIQREKALLGPLLNADEGEDPVVAPTVPFTVDDDQMVVSLCTKGSHDDVCAYVPIRVSAPACIRDLRAAESQLLGHDFEMGQVTTHVPDDVALTDGMTVDMMVEPGVTVGVDLIGRSGSEVADLLAPQDAQSHVGMNHAGLVSWSGQLDSRNFGTSETGWQSPLVGLSADILVGLHGPAPTRTDQLAAIYGQSMLVKDRVAVLRQQGHVMANDEMLWHLREMQREHAKRVELNMPSEQRWNHARVVVLDPMLLRGWMVNGCADVAEWIQTQCTLETCVVTAAPLDGHWIPLVMWPCKGMLNVSSWDSPTADHSWLVPVVRAIAKAWKLQGPYCQRIHRMFLSDKCCGALALSFVQHHILMTQIPDTDLQAFSWHDGLRCKFLGVVQGYETCVRPWVWCAGVHEQAVQGLTPLLAEQGVHGPECATRADAAVRAIGAKQVLHALELRHPWKQLKTLGNMAKFQFLLQSELESKIASGAGKQRLKGKKSKGPPVEKEFQLDPSKLTIAPGCFQADGSPVPQLALSQVGPLAEGIVLVSPQEAEPYVRAAQVVSSCPLALVVVSGDSLSGRCQLANSSVTVPCRCSLNQEPLLVDALLIQIGKGFIEKASDTGLVEVEAMDVCTIKVTVYRDELSSWDDFAASPLKYITSKCPLLTRCDQQNCKCPKFHPDISFESKTVLLDVWRRQFLRIGFKPEQPKAAQLFSTCIRIPLVLRNQLLLLSGTNEWYLL